MSTSLTLSPASALLATSVPASLAPAVLAYLADQQPVRELSFTELVPLIGDLLNGAALLMGHRNALADVDDLDLMATGVAALIQRRFGSLKPAELSEAFQRGASGEYLTDPKELHQVALPCIAKWLDGYQARARAQVVAAAQQAAQPLALPAPRIDYVGSVVNYVALAKAGELPAGFDLDIGNVLYTWLKEAGALNGFRTPEQYAQMQQQETDQLLAVKLPESGAERREYTSFIKALRASGELPDAHPLSRSVVNACKKRLLREWLEHHANAGTNIVDFLTERLAAQ
jgi:hypothetical protein